MTVSIRDAVLIAAVLMAALFFGLWRHASAKLDDCRTSSAGYAEAAKNNARRLVTVIDAHNKLVADLRVERTASRLAAQRVEHLRQDLRHNLAQNAALRAQLKQERPDVQDYYAQPVPRPVAELLLHNAAAPDRDQGGPR